MDQRDFARKACEERRFFASGIAATDDQNVLVSEKRAVACGTCRNPSALLFGFTRGVQPHGFCSGADDDGMGQESLTFDHDFVGTLAQVHLVDVFVFNFQTETLGLFPELHHHLRAGNTFWVAGKIFDIAGEHQLSTGHVASEHEGVEHGPSGIEAGRVACRS